MLRQFLTGFTHSLRFDFFDEIGDRTGVDSPQITIFTPEKNKFVDGSSLTAIAGVTGGFNFNFFVSPGLTFGQWFAIGTGLTAGNALVLADQVPFEVIDLTVEPFWVSLAELREYLEIADNDHTRDRFNKQLLQSAMELTEAFTKREFGTRIVNQTIEVNSTSRIKLKAFPVQQIVGLTATARVIPRNIDQLIFETITDEPVSFFFRLDEPNGIMILTDNAGFELERDGILLGITYRAGFAVVPEPVRQATLALASQLVNLATNEGFDSIRLADLSFTLSKGLFKGHIGDMLKPYRNVSLWSSSTG